MDTGGSFAVYRQLYAELPHKSIEAEGITDQFLFEAALADPRTVTLELANGAVLPLVVPLEVLPYVKLSTYQQRAAAGIRAPLFYYSHLPSLLTGWPEAYAAALRPAVRQLALHQGVLAFDHPAARSEAVLSQVHELLCMIGGVACRELIDQDELRHFHWVTGAEPELATSPPIRSIELPELYRQALTDGSLTPDGHVSVEARLSQPDIDHLWRFYGPVHDEMADTIEAGFNQIELQAILQDPRYAKLVYRVGGNIMNMALAAEVRDCPWLNSDYFREQYPDAFRDRRIICGIGAITDPEAARSYAPTVRTLGMIGRLVAYAGGRAVFAFACDDQSNQYAPLLTVRALQRSGLAVDLSQPVGFQQFHAVQLEPGAPGHAGQ